ncbi:hypothetical protein [Rhizobium sp. WCS2018Hpa-8]|nr:hypothetical protein [Rhizobium sp. WCS2018Hpa-8]
MAKKRPQKDERKASFTTWKLNLENTVSADPLADGACLQIVRAYLDFMGSPDARPYRSLIDLQVATSLSENTIINKRRKLEALKYFEADGKTGDGATRYKIINARENIVLDHQTISRETLLRLDAEKKEKTRLKRKISCSSPSNIEVQMSPSDFAGLNAFEPLKDCGDSPSDFEGNYVYNTVESYSSEEREELISPSSLSNSYSSTLSPDEANMPLPVPEDDHEANAMMDQICEGRSVHPSVRNRLMSMLKAGVLTPRMASNILGPRQEAAA